MATTKTAARNKRPAGEFVQPIEPASGTHDGEPFVVNPREIFRADHPLVRAYPHLFRPLCESQRPDIVQMTAAPGEKRGKP